MQNHKSDKTMQNETKGITFSALARELNCPASSITRLVKSGMPRNSDGSLDRQRCLEFIARNTSGSAGGWQLGSCRGLSLGERAQRILRGQEAKEKPTDFLKNFDFNLQNLLEESPDNGNLDHEEFKEQYFLRAGAMWIVRHLLKRKIFKILRQLLVEGAACEEGQAKQAAALIVYLIASWVDEILDPRWMDPKLAGKFHKEVIAWGQKNIISRDDEPAPAIASNSEAGQ
jgi:hypothetical protein